jgi:hypothetical protein
MTDQSNRVISPVLGLAAVLLAPLALAQAPSAAPALAQEKPAKASEKAELKAARAEAKAEKAETKAAEKAERVDPPSSRGDGQHGRGPGHADFGHHRGGFRALGEDFRQGRIKKPELKARLAAMRETAKERRREHQHALEKRWGAALAHPACQAELRLHARREAFLNRALFVAETEVTKDKEKVVERIQKLIAREDERHARAMERFKTMPAGVVPATPPGAGSAAAPGASAAPSPAGSAAAPTPAASAEKGGAQ